MTDWGKSNRVDRFEFVLCDPKTLAEVGKVDADPAASSLTWGYYTDNLYSGTITLAGTNPTKLSKDRLVRVRHIVEADGEVSSRNLATMFVKECAGTSKFKLQTYKASCYSTLYRFTQDVITQDLSRKKGYNLVKLIREVVEATGGKLRVLDGVNLERQIKRNIWFELGTNRMEILNTAAGWMNCQIGCDEDGYVTLYPYVKPSKKNVKYTFEAGRNCTYLPGVEEEDNRSDIVNRVLMYFSRESKEKGDTLPLTDRAVATLPEKYAFSYARCGRYQTTVVKLTEPCSHEDLVEKAETYLMENSGEIRHHIIEHVSIPDLTVGDVVLYENDTDYAEPVSDLCMVVQMDMKSLTPGAKCTTKLKIID